MRKRLSFPCKKGIVMKWLTMTPKKPASSQRKVIKLKMKISSSKYIKIYSYVLGETFKEKLREYSLILSIPKGKSDINLTYLRVIRGKLDCFSSIKRKKKRSLFGLKKIYYKKYNDLLLKDLFEFLN